MSLDMSNLARYHAKKHIGSIIGISIVAYHSITPCNSESKIVFLMTPPPRLPQPKTLEHWNIATFHDLDPVNHTIWLSRI